MIKRLNLLLATGVMGIALVSGSTVLAASKTLEVATKGQPVSVQLDFMEKLHARLAALPQPAEKHVVDLTADELAILTNPEIDSTGRLRVGVQRVVGRSVLHQGKDLVISVPGAPAIRLELARVTGTVAVYNDSGQAHEYTADGFTHTFTGEEVTVRGSAHITGVGAVNLEGSNLCEYNAACVESAACQDIPPEIEEARDAYASILFISRGSWYVCSGGLIADSDTGSEIPYFLTANHCISKDREAGSLEAFFQYTHDECGTGECAFPPEASTVGSTIIATNSTSDYSLLRLAQDPPTDSVYLGWNDNPVAFSHGAELFRISHPRGAPQAYSEHSVDTSKITCRSWPRGEWIYSHDTTGATEGGSSGSPVLNAEGHVVGQLSGACGLNVYEVCDADSNATVDGAFAAYYSEVSQYLGPGGGTDPEVCDDGIDNDGDGLIDCDDDDCNQDPVCTSSCTDEDGDGWCEEDGDCNDADASVNPDAKDRGGRWKDGIDNDCDGIIDG